MRLKWPRVRKFTYWQIVWMGDAEFKRLMQTWIGRRAIERGIGSRWTELKKPTFGPDGPLVQNGVWFAWRPVFSYLPVRRIRWLRNVWKERRPNLNGSGAVVAYRDITWPSPEELDLMFYNLTDKEFDFYLCKWRQDSLAMRMIFGD